MLRLKLNKKNILKANFYGFETEKLTSLINLSFLLLFILFFCIALFTSFCLYCSVYVCVGSTHEM